MASKTLTEQINKQINEMENKLQILRGQMENKMRAHGEEFDVKAGTSLGKARDRFDRSTKKLSGFLKRGEKTVVKAGKKMTDDAILKVLEKYIKPEAFEGSSGSTGGRKRRRTKKKKTKRKKTKKRVKRRKGMTRKSRGRKTRGRKRRR